MINLSSDCCISEIDSISGFSVIIGNCSSNLVGVALQAVKLLIKLAKKVQQKELVSQHGLSFLIGLLSSPNDNLKISSATALYYLFEERSIHTKFVNGYGAQPLVKLVESNPGAQIWALGAIGRLAQTTTAFRQVEAVGLDKTLSLLLTSRSALILAVAGIITGPGDLQQKMINVEAHIRPTLDKAGADI